MKKTFKILPLFTATIFCFNTSFSISTDATTITEGSSHFSVSETEIFQAENPKAKDKVFSEFYRPAKIHEPGAYMNAIHCFAKERCKIADICVRSHLLEHTESLLFRKFRPKIDPKGYNVFKTSLNPTDNTYLYNIAIHKFQTGPTLTQSSIGTLSIQRQFVSFDTYQDTKERHQAIFSKTSLNSKEQSFLKDPLCSEIYTYDSLLATESAHSLFENNPELGNIIKMNDKIYAVIGDNTVFTTLRSTLTIDGEQFNIGSISCLSIPRGSSFEYFPLFTLGHTRAHQVEGLLAVADKYWKNSLEWDKTSGSHVLFENMAKVFWLQTIAAPYSRGSESNAKAQLECIARYHGEELVYSPKLAFRMPFILSPDEFTEYFQNNVYFKSELENMID